jgi:hypothetical protein
MTAGCWGARTWLWSTACLGVALAACEVPDPEAPADTPADHAEITDPELPDPEIIDGYWANLSHHCGQAFPGGLTLEPPGDPMLEGNELLVVHFRVCEEDELQVPFHIEQMDGEWDRSRTWIFRRTDDERIELRHDHRTPDGSEDENTWYGAWTMGEGTPTRQEFIIQDREYPDGSTRGWRIIIEPGERYVYGTIRNGEWTWRVDFDLSEPLDEPPPPAWGYEDGGGPLR